jgi:chemotaxis protein MotB
VRINRQLSDKLARLHHENLKLRAENAELKLDTEALKRKYGVLEGLTEDLKRRFGPLLEQGDIEITPGGDLRIQERVLFSSGHFELTAGGKRVLAKVADALKGRNDVLRIDGHTDTDPINKARKRGITSNWHLSVMRALKVLEELAANGISEKRMYIAGYGQQWPIADNSTAAGKRRNRRVEIVILPARRMPTATEAEPAVAPEM